MPISFECDRCHRPYQVDESLAGKRVKCKQCENVLTIPSHSQAMLSEEELRIDVGGHSSAPIRELGGMTRGHGGSEEPIQRGNPESPVAAWSTRVQSEIDRVFVGQEELLRGVLIAFLAQGHVLIESVPGLGKTLLVRTLGRVLGCSFNRIQFTPDLMPSDVTGSPIYDERTQDFRFRPGPVFTQLLLADEINRAPAKTHSALLEIMQERRVTVDGVPHPLEPPFLVMATQNPIESEGTYNLPEAQLDRFLFKLFINYPSAQEETQILRLHTEGKSPESILTDQVQTVTSPPEVLEMQKRCDQVLVDERVIQYISNLVRRTRDWPAFSIGASPRAGVAILRGARAAAALEGRDYVVPDDVQEVALPALRHRVMLTAEAEVEGREVDEILGDLIRTVEVPRQ